MTSTTLVENELSKLISAHGGDYTAAWQAIVAAEERKALIRYKAGSNVEARKKRWSDAVRKRDKTVLERIGEVFSSHLSIVKRNAKITSADPHVLSKAEAKSLLVEYLNGKNAEEFLKARKEEIKKQVFASMDIQFAEAGEEVPEQVNGNIAVTLNGVDYEFRREGAGIKDAAIDEDKFRAEVGEEVWAKITVEEVVPEQRVRTLDMDLLLALARKQTTLLLKVQDALVVEPKSPRFVVREIKSKE